MGAADDVAALQARVAALEAENTALRHSEAETRDGHTGLAASEERLRRIIEGAHDHAIIALDLQGRITGWSRGAENVLGWTEGEALGRGRDVLARASSVKS